MIENELHILMVEDNIVDAEVIQRLLKKEKENIDFTHASSREEFIYALDQRKYDIILADNSLPQFSGTEALLLLHQRGLRTPFILVTGTVSEEFAASIIKLGAWDYILKDRLTRLPSAIDAAINHYKGESDRLEAYSKLILSEEKYRTLIERISDAFIALDNNWNYTYANRQAGILVHRDSKSLIGKNVWEEFPEAIGSTTYINFHKAMKEQQFIMHTDYFEPLDLWQENYIYPSVDGISVFIRDITQRKKAEDELLHRNEELRELSTHLQEIREQERIHIAREIHDELGQQLTGLKMDMLWLQKQLKNADDSIKDKIAGAVELINETVKSVRRISSDLRPSMLDDLGLTAALEWHGQQVAKRSEIQIDFLAPQQELKIPLDISIAIFRIYQEALTNAVKHANAKTIIGKLDYHHNYLRLSVKDDGKGMDTQQLSQRKTFGLVGIKERTFMLGGNFELKTEPGKGTEIIINIPYQQT